MAKYQREKLVYPLAVSVPDELRNRYWPWAMDLTHRQSGGRINGWRCGRGCGIRINGQPSHRINLRRAGSHRSLRESLLRIGRLRPLLGFFRGFIIQHLAYKQPRIRRRRAFGAFLAVGPITPPTAVPTAAAVGLTGPQVCGPGDGAGCGCWGLGMPAAFRRGNAKPRKGLKILRLHQVNATAVKNTIFFINTVLP